MNEGEIFFREKLEFLSLKNLVTIFLFFKNILFGYIPYIHL